MLCRVVLCCVDRRRWVLLCVPVDEVGVSFSLSLRIVQGEADDASTVTPIDVR